MESDLEPPTATTTTTTTVTTTTTTGNHSLSPPISYYDNDSNCSTPYVSAPSSPGRTFSSVGVGFFYSAPASPMHFILSTSPATISLAPATSDASSSASFEFEFSSRFDSPAREISPSMSSADELFLNGQIRPMKLSAHLQRPQTLAPLISDNEDDDDDDGDVFKRRRDLRLRDRSQRRRTRSLSPLRNTTPFDWLASDDTVLAPKKEEIDRKEEEKNETTPSGSASSSRCSSAGRSSKRWVFLKDFLRSKSEGRSNNKFWQNISFSPVKEKKAGREKGRNNNNNNDDKTTSFLSEEKEKMMKMRRKSLVTGAKSVNRRSAHEMHYTANRAQAEEMRKKTFLPYRQGLLGCLGFNSKSYGALNGFARALNPVSSR